MTDNHFARLRALGYARLVPIIPPDAPISSGSSLFKRVGTPQDARGKTPGIKGRDGKWFSFDWVPHEADAEDGQRWHRMGAGAGIKTGQGLIAIDADTTDLKAAEIIRDETKRSFGKLPVRVGRYPKALYLIRVDGPFQYQRVEFGVPDATGRLTERVEMLSDGRQFVAEGTHPKTAKPYTWPVPLAPYDELPAATPEQLRAYLERLRNLLPQAAPIITEGAAPAVNQAALKGDLEQITKAVNATPNTTALFPSREAYRDYGYAIKASLPDDPEAAFALYSDWCARWDDPTGNTNDPDVVAADWSRMHPPFKRGAHYVYELAEKHSNGHFDQSGIWFDDLTAEDDDNPFAHIERQTAATQQANLFKLLTIEDIERRPKPRWLVARHIPVLGVGFLYSEPGAGKSFLALDIALHIAYGRPDWYGDIIDAPPTKVVLYIAAEGSYGFRNRIAAWRLAHKADAATARFLMIEQTIDFMKADDIEKLLRTCRQLNIDPCLVFVDTVSRALPGADENLQKDMSIFIKACDAVRDAFGCAVVGIHHEGKSGDMRGSTVLRGASDFLFHLTRKKGATIGDLACEKMKDGPDGWVEPYRFDVVGLPEGESSLVPVRAEVGFGPSIELTPEVSGRVLGAMRAAWSAGEPWAKAANTKERNAVRRMVVDFGFEASRAEELLEVWEQTGVIRLAEFDAKRHRKGYSVGEMPGQDVPQDGIFG